MSGSRILIVIALLTLALVPAALTAQPSIESNFDRTWSRADGPVAAGLENRTWVWGPTKYGPAIYEEYIDSLDGERIVQYFDKSRMEITHPGTDPSSPWYVTNGLLVVELITGQLQIGDAAFEVRLPAQINVAGDADDNRGPTYATFSELLDAAPTPAGWLVTAHIDRDGAVVDHPDVYGLYNITIAAVDEVTNHSIASPFWDFMYASGLIWDGTAYTNGPLFPDPLFALGRPITEPYWADVKVAGTVQDVLLQCFERRCVTFTPENPEGWQVEAGNVGLHYYNWRYGTTAPVDPEPIDPTPTIPPVGEPTITPDPTPDPVEPEPTQTPHPNEIRWPPGQGSGQGGAYNCEDFATQQEAQEYFNWKGGSPTNNVDGLDRDGDGIACENNPRGGGGGAVSTHPPSRTQP